MTLASSGDYSVNLTLTKYGADDYDAVFEMGFPTPTLSNYRYAIVLCVNTGINTYTPTADETNMPGFAYTVRCIAGL